MADPTWRIFAGRFQPFHNGHLWIVEQLVQQHGRVIVGIVNPDPASPPDIKYPSFHPLHNPFDFWERLQMVRGSVAASGLLEKVIIVPLQHPRAELASDQAYLPRLRRWIVPPLDDHETDKILDLQRLGEEVETIAVPSEYRFLSSALIRNCLLVEGDGCLSLCASPPHPCCPSAVAAILAGRSAVLRIARLAKRHASEPVPKGGRCPFLPSESKESNPDLDGLASSVLSQLAQCRQQIDSLDPNPQRRAERKRAEIVPLEERVAEAARTRRGADVEAVAALATTLHRRLSSLLAKQGG